MQLPGLSIRSAMFRDSKIISRECLRQSQDIRLCYGLFNWNKLRWLSDMEGLQGYSLARVKRYGAPWVFQLRLNWDLILPARLVAIAKWLQRSF